MIAAPEPLEDAQQAPPTRRCRFCDAPLPAYGTSGPRKTSYCPYKKACVDASKERMDEVRIKRKAESDAKEVKGVMNDMIKKVLGELSDKHDADGNTLRKHRGMSEESKAAKQAEHEAKQQAKALLRQDKASGLSAKYPGMFYWTTQIAGDRRTSSTAMQCRTLTVTAQAQHAAPAEPSAAQFDLLPWVVDGGSAPTGVQVPKKGQKRGSVYAVLGR
jgi:hypothetical protein